MPVNGFNNQKERKPVYTIEEVDNKLVKRSNIVVLKGQTSEDGTATISYPKGFTQENCIVLNYMFKGKSGLAPWGSGSVLNSSNVMNGTIPTAIKLLSDNIKIELVNIALINEGSTTVATLTTSFEYKLVLMKYEVLDSEYTLGDVNQDGVIDENDFNLVNSYLSGETALTEQQLKASDINKDGKIDAMDTYKLQQYIANGTPLE